MAVEPSKQREQGRHVLRGTESVLAAARGLRGALDAGTERRELAISRLEQATATQEGAADRYQAFMFEATERAPDDPQQRELVAADSLALVLADVEVGNVLIAAGQALGETGETADPKVLDDAVLRLDNTRKAFDRAQAGPSAATAGLRYGFGPEAAKAVRSQDLPAAIAGFRQRSEATLALVLDESVGVVSKTLEALSKLGQVGEALAKLGGPLEQLPKVGRLIGLGLRKLRRAIAALVKLLGDDGLKRIKGQIEDLWKKATSGQVLASTLGKLFAVEATRRSIAEILRSDRLEIDRLDEASADLDRLCTSCKQTMSMMGGILSATTLVGGVLAVTPVAGTTLTLVVGTVELLVIGAILLIGMDYADSGRGLRRVRGVGEIANGLVVVHA